MARIALPIAEDFEDWEVDLSIETLSGAGHDVLRVGPAGASPGDLMRGWRGQSRVRLDTTAEAVDASLLDALLIPGGESPRRLRDNPATVDLLRRVFRRERPVAAICQGPTLLVAADVVRDFFLTSEPSLREELEEAGARWLDRGVVEDRHLITARRPEDLPAFCRAVGLRLP